MIYWILFIIWAILAFPLAYKASTTLPDTKWHRGFIAYLVIGILVFGFGG